MQKTALILGATGGFGNASLAALQRHGWRLRALARDPDVARRRLAAPHDIDWRGGDALAAADVARAAEGVDLLVHAVNPPGYRNWQGLALPMLDNAIAAARGADARLVLPGNVYNFGTDAGPLLREDSPQHPRSRKGAVRVEMERRLAVAAGEGLRALVLRAGDFFGPHAPASWLQTAMVKPGRPLTRVVYPGETEVGHTWAYLPDLTETLAQLADRDSQLEPFAVFHFAGHYCERGIDFAHAIARAAGRPDLPVKGFPWWLVGLAAPAVPLFREVGEMRYVWREPLRLDNARLVATLGREPHTPLVAALRETLLGLGCVAAEPTVRARQRALA